MLTSRTIALLIQLFLTTTYLLAQQTELVFQHGHSKEIDKIMLSPDGRYMVSIADNSEIFIWDLSLDLLKGKLEFPWEGPNKIKDEVGMKNKLKDIYFADDGEKLIGFHEGRSRTVSGEPIPPRLIIWDYKRGKIVDLLDLPKALEGTVFINDGKRFIGFRKGRSGSNTRAATPPRLVIWNYSKGETVEQHDLPATIGEALDKPSISAEGDYITLTSGAHLATWKLEPFQLIHEFKVARANPGPGKESSFSYTHVRVDAERNLIYTGIGLPEEKLDFVEIRDFQTGELRYTLKDDPEKANLKSSGADRHIIDIEPFGKDQLIVIDQQGSYRIVVWDLVTQMPIHRPDPIEAKSFSLSEDGSSLITAYRDIKRYPFPFREPEMEIDDDESLFRGMDIYKWQHFSLNRKKGIAVAKEGATGDTKFGVYDLNLGRKIKTIERKEIGTIEGLAFGKEGQLVTGHSESGIRIWDLKHVVNAKNSAPVEVYGFHDMVVDFQHQLVIGEKKYWSFDDPETILKLEDADRSWSISPDNKWLVSYNGEVYDLETMEMSRKLDGKYTSDAKAHFSQNNEVLLIPGVKQIQRWRLPGFQKIDPIELPSEKTSMSLGYQIKPLPDNTFIFQKEDSFSIRSLYSGAVLQEKVLPFHLGRHDPICMSQDGKFMMIAPNRIYRGKQPIASSDIIIYSLPDFREVKRLSGHVGKVEHLTMAPEGHLLASGGTDGTVKLWDWKAGKLVATVLGLEGQKYFIYTPDNYYMTSKGVTDVAFSTGNSVYPFEQFDLYYNRPDIVLERLGYADQEIIQALNRSYQKRLAKLGITQPDLRSLENLPQLNIIGSVPQSTDEDQLALIIECTDEQYNLRRLQVFQNEVPLSFQEGEDVLKGRKARINLSLPLVSGSNRFQFLVINEKGATSLQQSFEIRRSSSEKPDLHLVVVGVSKYREADMNLKYAAKDARDVAALFTSRPTAYRKIHVHQFLDEAANRQEILAVKEKLMQSRPEDRVIVFLAGHGLLDDQLNYYFATHQVDFANPAAQGIAFDEMENLLNEIPARQKALLIDACHAGEVDKEEVELVTKKQEVDGEVTFRSFTNKTVQKRRIGLDNSFELMKNTYVDLRRNSGAVIIAAAGGAEYAIEGDRFQNGVFTHCLRKALAVEKDLDRTLRSDRNGDHIITISEIQQYLTVEVPKLTQNRQQPLNRVDYLYNDFEIFQYKTGNESDWQDWQGRASKEDFHTIIDQGINVHQVFADGSTWLMKAIDKQEEDDPSTLQKLVDLGADPYPQAAYYPKYSYHWNDYDYFGGLTAVAASEGKIKMLQYLVEQLHIPVDSEGWNVETQQRNGWTALQWAAYTRRYKNEGVRKAIRYLVQKGADIEKKESKNNKTPLLLAFSKPKNFEIGQLLIELGANIFATDKAGWSALHYAARWGETDMVRSLVNKGLDINLPAKDGWTPLMLAGIHEHYSTFNELLIAGADTSLQTKAGNTIAQLASQKELLTLHELMAYPGSTDRDLFVAIKNKDKAAIRQLLKSGASLNTIDGYGASLFMQLVHEIGDLAFIKEVMAYRPSLSSKGVIWTNRVGGGYYGNLQCIVAAKGQLEILKYLVENLRMPIDDPEYNPQDDQYTGWTALQWAASQRRTEVMNYLLQRSANINVGIQEGDTPALLYVKSNPKDISENWWLRSQVSIARTTWLLSNQNINARDKFGWTISHYISRGGAINYDLVGYMKQLKELGADFNIQGQNGWTPLMLATQNKSYGRMEQLVEAQANLNLRNKEGDTALMLAYKKKLKGFCRFLLEQESLDCSLVNAEGQKALDIALALDLPEIAQQIKKRADCR